MGQEHFSQAMTWTSAQNHSTLARIIQHTGRSVRAATRERAARREVVRVGEVRDDVVQRVEGLPEELLVDVGKRRVPRSRLRRAVGGIYNVAGR